MKICTRCGKKLGNKEPGAGATWSISICDYCRERSYTTEPRDFGIQTEEPDPKVEELMNLFNMK